MAALRVLAFAVASKRVGSVFLVGGRLVDWQISDKASQSNVEVAGHVQSLINDLQPDVVVTEEPETAYRKGEHSLELIAAIARTAQHNNLLDVSVPRPHTHPNKYAEADALVERFPELLPWKPTKRRFYDPEPRNTVLFEALALAATLSEPSVQS